MCHSVLSELLSNHTQPLNGTLMKHTLKPLNETSTLTTQYLLKPNSEFMSMTMGGVSLTAFHHFHFFCWAPCSICSHCGDVTWWASGWPGGRFGGLPVNKFPSFGGVNTMMCDFKKRHETKCLQCCRRKEKVQLGLIILQLWEIWGAESGAVQRLLEPQCNGFPPPLSIVAHHCCQYDWAIECINAKVIYNLRCV